MAANFKDKVVWITGASSGIGAALAKEFHRQGAFVALSARRAERLKDLAKELGPKAHVFSLDVHEKSLVEKTAKDIHDRLGKIDVVVANAGYAVRAPFLSISEEMWRRQLETNLFGVVWTIQAAIPFLEQSRGRVAIMSSIMGKLALTNVAAYAASKFALMGLANALYQELYEKGISVTNIAPGFVESEIYRVDNLGQQKGDNPAFERGKNLRWPTNKAAQAMAQAIFYRKREAVITGHAKLVAFFASHLPSLTYWALARLRPLLIRRGVFNEQKELT